MILLSLARNVNLKHKAIDLLLSHCIYFDCVQYRNGSKSNLVICCKKTGKELVSLLPESFGGLWRRLAQGTPNNSVKYDLPAQ